MGKISLYSRALSTSILLLLLSSCSFRLADDFAYTNSDRSLSLLVKDDIDGICTEEVVKAIDRYTSYRYDTKNGHFILLVEIIHKKSENIGFKYDKKKLANNKKALIPNETRKRVLAKITIRERGTNQIVLKPTFIVGECAFDHENYTVNNEVNATSLGQLTDIDTAQVVITTPLFRDLAQKIANYIANY